MLAPTKRLKLTPRVVTAQGSLEGRQSPLLTAEPERPGALPHGSIILINVRKMMGMGPGRSIATAVSHFRPSVPQKRPSGAELACCIFTVF